MSKNSSRKNLRGGKSSNKTTVSKRLDSPENNFAHSLYIVDCCSHKLETQPISFVNKKKSPTVVKPRGSKFWEPFSPMNMGSTDSPPTYPLQNSFKEVVARCWLAGAKAVAEAIKEARTKDFIFSRQLFERCDLRGWGAALVGDKRGDAFGCYGNPNRTCSASIGHLLKARRLRDVVTKTVEKI